MRAVGIPLRRPGSPLRAGGIPLRRLGMGLFTLAPAVTGGGTVQGIVDVSGYFE